PRSARTLGLVTLAGVLLAAVATFLVGRGVDDPVPTLGRTVQLTRDPGLEVDPALSPDGEMVAFAAGPPTRMQIYVRAVTGGRQLPLTDQQQTNHRWPRWSPDGANIAYQSGDGVWVVARMGGPARLVARLPAGTGSSSPGAFTPLAGLTWAPDGRRIVFAGGMGAEGLYLVDVEGGAAAPDRLPSPREPHSPAWSPDGTRLAVASGNSIFVFGGAYFGNAGQSSIWIVPLDGAEPVRVTEEPYLDVSPAWSSDGRFLYWVSDRGGSRDVYRVRIDSRHAPVGDPVRITTGLDVHSLDLASGAPHLAYANLRTLSNIWSMSVPDDRPASIAEARPVTTGNQTIEDVDVSADGAWLAFDSDRGGDPDIYKLRVGTTEPIRLTTHPSGDFAAFWAPDDTRVGFHSMRNGNRDLFTIAPDGTDLRQVTSSPAHELDGDWSPDGDAIVAEIIEPGGVTADAFLVVPLEGGEADARRIDALGDFAAWSPDGALILYHASDGLRVVGPEGGNTRLLVSNDADGSEAFYGAWSPDGNTVYYLTRGAEEWAIRSVPRDGGTSRLVVRFDDPGRQQARYGFTTDGETFYFTLGSHESDVWVVELEGG
ncbi:MAG TPA: hypothetical protein VLL48_14645, partial [Longimicrobiales bacterium]|nr:hypothetical protein [Longimicrobiales bacterium]